MESTSIGLQLAASGVARRGDLIVTEGMMGVGGGRGEAIWTEGMGAVSEESASDLLSSSMVRTSTSLEVDRPVGQGESGSIMVDCFGNIELGEVGMSRWSILSLLHLRGVYPFLGYTLAQYYKSISDLKVGTSNRDVALITRACGQSIGMDLSTRNIVDLFKALATLTDYMHGRVIRNHHCYKMAIGFTLHREGLSKREGDGSSRDSTLLGRAFLLGWLGFQRGRGLSVSFTLVFGRGLPQQKRRSFGGFSAIGVRASSSNCGGRSSGPQFSRDKSLGSPANQPDIVRWKRGHQE